MKANHNVCVRVCVYLFSKDSEILIRISLISLLFGIFTRFSLYMSTDYK